MAGLSRRNGHRELNAWPGWVDALSSLVMVVIFLLMVFVVAQFYLATALTGRDEQLQSLSRKVAELNDLLAMERDANADLRVNIAQMSDQLQASVASREDLTAAMGRLRDERDTGAREAASLATDIRALREMRQRLEGEMAERAATLRLSEEQRQALLTQLGSARDRSRELEARLAETGDRTMLAQKDIALRDQQIAALDRQIAAAGDAAAAMQKDLARRDQQIAALNRQIAEASDVAAATQKDLARRDQQIAALNRQIAESGERAAAAQKDAAQRDQQIGALNRQITEAGGRAAAAQKDIALRNDQIDALTRQIAALREQLARIGAALDISEKKASEQQVQIADLGARLNQALASKVQELARYRSEFFGRMRETLGTRQDIRIVGDRFVFQSDILFPSASAELQEAGKRRMAELAHTLLEIGRTIPADINWALRVDGHTDLRPITRTYASNWELSAARAIAVVKFLTEQGIPAERLVAAGFGEWQPLDAGISEEALARNRRIEIKFDQR